MSTMLNVMLTFFISSIHGFLCPLTQTMDTHRICHIFHNTNIQAVADIDFTDDDYCKSGSIYIRCNPTGSTINIVEMERISLNGELDTTNGWPQNVTMIDLEQEEWNVPSALFGYWDWNSLKNMNKLSKIDIENNEFAQTLHNTDWNIIAALPSLTDLNMIGNWISTNFSKISLNTVSNIQYLELSWNNFYGTMDVSTNGFISKFPQLINFWISHNDIKGHFNNLNVFSSNYVPNLNEISIENNIFSGQLIMTNSFKFADSLTEFEIDYNEFYGDIDWNIFNHLYGLQVLDINDNAFTGNINWNIISDLTNNGVLNKIHLKNNSFTGYVDFSWMTTGWIDFSLDVNIHCDPIIYPCIGGVTSDRTKKYCYSKSECEASCQCTQTNKPTNKPTKKPTNKPSDIPTHSPSKDPTLTPTDIPTSIPTTSPTKNPTPSPTDIPTNNPTTPRPTTPDQLFCGDSDTGTYSGVFLTFNVQMAYYADLIFDASQSTFNVTTIEAFSKLNIALGQDTQHDEILTLFNHPPGDYKFIIDGADLSGTYNIQITCTSDSPTATPTNKPSSAPIQQHILTYVPIESTELIPSLYPTKKPTSLTLVTEIIKTTDIISETTINDGTQNNYSFLEMNSFSLILIGMLCGLFFIICCMLVLAILIFNNYYKRKDEQHTEIDDSIKQHTGIDDFFDGIDNTVIKQLPPIIVPNKNMVDAIWNSSVYSEGLPGPNSVKTTVNQPIHLQNNISTCTDMESMYGSVKSIVHITPMNLNTMDQLNENCNDEEEYEYEYYYEY